MYNLDRIKNIISKITYKPNWKIEVIDNSLHFHITNLWYEGVTIRITTLQDSIENLKEKISIVNQRTFSLYDLSKMKDEDIIQHVIAYIIKDTELHEMDEWLKYDGICVKDPHPELKKRG